MAGYTSWIIATPNEFNSNAFWCGYTKSTTYQGTQQHASESDDWYFVYSSKTAISGATTGVMVSPYAGVEVRKYDQSGHLTNTIYLNQHISTPYGDVYYALTQGTYFIPAAEEPALPSSQLTPSGCTFNQELELVAYGSKQMWYTEPISDPYENLGDNGLGGDVIPVPNLPTLSAVNTGICTLYVPTAAEMRVLADFLWTDRSQQTPSTVIDALVEVAQALWRTLSDPMKVIMGLTIIPSRGLHVSSGRYGIQAGMFTVPACYMHVLESQYYEVDCGTLNFAAVCGDTFLDYAPYSKFQIYLPFVGIVSVDANDFVGHTIGVKYHVDALSGACTAYITKDGGVYYTYSGNVSLNIPLSADSWATTLQTAVQLVASGVNPPPGNANANLPDKMAELEEYGKGGGGATYSLGKAAGNAALAALNPAVLSPAVSRSGAVASAAGFMNIMRPFVIREAVRFQSTEGMAALHGYPLHATRKIGGLNGFTVIKDVHVEGIPATASEISEIESILAGGVIL